MERNSESSSGLKWENLALYGGESIEIQEHVGFSLSITNNLYPNDLGTRSSSNPDSGFSKFSSKDSMDDFGKVGSLLSYKIQNISGNISSTSNSAGLSEPIIGLQLGSEKDFGESFIPSSTNVSLGSVPMLTAMKRSRLSPNTQNSFCCQVEGCNLDLTSAKDYHRRHRICEVHSKSPKVIVAGLERRFCQQCSRFHELSEFDDKKRSCRRRLLDHNARRRRQQPEFVPLTSAGLSLSSALYDRRAQNVISNRVPFSVSNSTLEIAGSSLLRHASRPSNTSGLETTSLHYSSDEIPRSISSLQVDSNRFSSFHSLSPPIFDQCIHVPTTNSPIAQQFESAQSLLSSNSWSLNETESTSMDSLVHGNWVRFLSNNHSVEQVNSSVNLDNSQEFQLFKNNHYDSGCFSSSQRNL